MLFTVTYLPQEGDPPETDVGGVHFVGNAPLELPPDKAWLAHKLAGNPWFHVDEHAPLPT